MWRFVLSVRGRTAQQVLRLEAGVQRLLAGGALGRSKLRRRVDHRRVEICEVCVCVCVCVTNEGNDQPICNHFPPVFPPLYCIFFCGREGGTHTLLLRRLVRHNPAPVGPARLVDKQQLLVPVLRLCQQLRLRLLLLLVLQQHERGRAVVEHHRRAEPPAQLHELLLVRLRRLQEHALLVEGHGVDQVLRHRRRHRHRGRHEHAVRVDREAGGVGHRRQRLLAGLLLVRLLRLLLPGLVLLLLVLLLLLLLLLPRLLLSLRLRLRLLLLLLLRLCLRLLLLRLLLLLLLLLLPLLLLAVGSTPLLLLLRGLLRGGRGQRHPGRSGRGGGVRALPLLDVREGALRRVVALLALGRHEHGRGRVEACGTQVGALVDRLPAGAGHADARRLVRVRGVDEGALVAAERAHEDRERRGQEVVEVLVAVQHLEQLALVVVALLQQLREEALQTLLRLRVPERREGVGGAPVAALVFLQHDARLVELGEGSKLSLLDLLLGVVEEGEPVCVFVCGGRLFGGGGGGGAGSVQK